MIMAKVTPQDWQERIEKAIRFKDQVGHYKDWENYREYYRGNFPGQGGGTNAGVLPYNLTFGFARTIVPSVYPRNPYLMASPRQGSTTTSRAKLIESVDNWLIDEMGVKKAFRTAVLQCYLCGRGILKVGYDSQFGLGDLERKTRAETTLTDVTGKEYLEYNSNIKPGMPWVVSVDPDMFLVPYGVKDLEDCQWVDHIILRALEDVKADVKYKGGSDIDATHVNRTLLPPGKEKLLDELMRDADIVELHEIRDGKRREVSTVVIGHDKYLRGPFDDPLQVEGFPFVDFCFNEDPEYFWCPSDVSILEPQQLEMNEARTQAMYHRRIALVKFLVQEGGINNDEAAKMLSEKVGPIVWVNGAPGSVVEMLQPHIPPELLGWVDAIREDSREIVGLARQELGADTATQDRMTATKSSFIHQASKTRMSEKHDAMADALQKVMRKVNQMIFKFWDKERVIEVVGVDAARYWVKVTGEELRNEYNLKVDMESMEPETKASRRETIVELIKALGKVPGIDINYLLRALVQEFEWLDAMRVFPEAPEAAGGAMSVNQFEGQQAQLAQNPQQLQDRTSQNTNRMVGAV